MKNKKNKIITIFTILIITIAICILILKSYKNNICNTIGNILIGIDILLIIIGSEIGYQIEKKKKEKEDIIIEIKINKE